MGTDARAAGLRFTDAQVVTGETVRNTAPVPADMLALMAALREDSQRFAELERGRR